MPNYPFTQNVIDSRLPTGSSRAEISQHLWRKPDVDMYFCIVLLGAPPRPCKGAARAANHMPAERNLSALKLLLAPLRSIVLINPAALRSELFRGHCTSSLK